MTQTAVEWLIKQYIKNNGKITSEDVAKAIEMEATQTQEAYNQGNEDAWELFYRMSKS